MPIVPLYCTSSAGCVTYGKKKVVYFRKIGIIPLDTWNRIMKFMSIGVPLVSNIPWTEKIHNGSKMVSNSQVKNHKCRHFELQEKNSNCFSHRKDYIAFSQMRSKRELFTWSWLKLRRSIAIYIFSNYTSTILKYCF